MTTIDYQVGASANDGNWTSSSYVNNATTVKVGNDFTTPTHTWALFTGVTIPVGATITAAYLSFYETGSFNNAEVDVYAEDSATPAAPTSYSDAAGKTKTTAYVDTVIPKGSFGVGGWTNTGDIKTVIQELVDSYNYSAGASMQFLLIAEGDYYVNVRQYDYSGNAHGPKLHIEYTEAATGNPYYAYAQQ